MWALLYLIKAIIECSSHFLLSLWLRSTSQWSPVILVWILGRWSMIMLLLVLNGCEGRLAEKGWEGGTWKHASLVLETGIFHECLILICCTLPVFFRSEVLNYRHHNLIYNLFFPASAWVAAATQCKLGSKTSWSWTIQPQWQRTDSRAGLEFYKSG